MMNNSKKIVITGGAGFVGSCLAICLKRNYPNYEIFVMDNLKRKGSELNLSRLSENNITFIHGDIRNREDFDGLPGEVTTVIEASAEPSVLAGLKGNPEYLVNTNLAGTINCLYWASKCRADFIFLSTSRVYPIQRIDQIHFVEQETRFAMANNQIMPGISKKGITEMFPLDGYRSLYGATKLASELMVQEFNHFYGMRAVINRCGVITGPWQMGKMDQGVMVLWVARHFWKKELAYIGYGGEGKQVRDILHIDDLYRLIDFQVHHMEEVNGEIFNAGGGDMISASLQELTGICQKVTGNSVPIKNVSENRAADIRIYTTDNSKVTQATGWQPQISVEKAVEDIFCWIKNNEDSLEHILNS